VFLSSDDSDRTASTPNRPLLLTHQHKISANKCLSFLPSHSLLSLLPLPRSTFRETTIKPSCTWQLYALIYTLIALIPSVLHFANNFLSFFFWCIWHHVNSRIYSLWIALADSSISIVTVYVFIAGLLVKEGIASNSEYILPLFSRFLCDSLSHSSPAVSACYIPSTTNDLHAEHELRTPV
jgi:hypothetical protein